MFQEVLTPRHPVPPQRFFEASPYKFGRDTGEENVVNSF
jgi:hypothetical protein